MLIQQQSCSNIAYGYTIYALVDTIAMNMVLSDGDPDYVALLSSGFVIHPNGPIYLSDHTSVGKRNKTFIIKMWKP